MKKYVNQLITDLKNAHKEEVEATEISQYDTEGSVEEKMQKHFEEAERYINFDEDMEQPFGYYVNLKKEQFPPVERLADEQMQLICDAFEQMMFSWNLYASLPDPIPVAMAYETLLTVLDRKVQIVEDGQISLEFCDYEPSYCVFKEHCGCREMVEEIEEEWRQGKLKTAKLLKTLPTLAANLPFPLPLQILEKSIDKSDCQSKIVKPIIEWIGLKLDDFASWKYCEDEERATVINTILTWWGDSNFLQGLKNEKKSYQQYEDLINFLGQPSIADGNGGFMLVNFPEKKETEQKRQNLLDRIKNGQNEDNMDLPF